jgi:drug/metabolite transporter (DMT)-like permease
MRALRMSAGVIVWALHFGFTALACARGFAGAVPWVAGAASALALAALLLILSRSRPRRDEFESWLAFSIAALGLAGVVFQTLPVYLVRTCV